MTDCRFFPFWMVALLLPASLVAQTLFDVHLHYSSADAAQFSPQDIITRLDRNGIARAVVTGTPAEHTQALYEFAPERIVPLLGVYRSHADKNSWPDDAALPERVETALRSGHWRGIGELHIFARDRHSAVLRRLIEIAAVRQLPLQLHTDPAIIDAVYDIAPRQTVIWAHAGKYPCPELIADYLQRYTNLYVDLSMRDARIAPQGRIDDAWYELFLKFPDRFMVGVDTYSVSRWHDFEAAVTGIREWLAQLPDDVAVQLAHANATRIFTVTE